jgi:Ran GTPase-activating protein 1
MSEFSTENSAVNERIVFELSGAREMVNEERAMELVSLSPPLAACSAVKMCNKSFSPEAASKIIQHIIQYENIVQADISDIIAGRPEEEALRTLSTFCDGLSHYKLKEVNLSDNALGRKGIHACSGVLVGKTIEKLYLCNNGLSAEACLTVADILLEGGCPPLTVLHFYNNMSGSNGASAISKVVQSALLLQDFRFSATRSGNEGCLAIAQARLAFLVHHSCIIIHKYIYILIMSCDI